MLQGKAKYTEGKKTINILCYGDSNTYGFCPEPGKYRYDYEERWTTMLADKLGSGYCISPEGLNGRTTAYDRPGACWKNGLTPFVSAIGTHKPVDIIVIMLGTNDCNPELELSAEDIASGMESLVTAAEENCKVIQGYKPEIIIVAPGALGDSYSDPEFSIKQCEEAICKSHELGKLYADVARAHNCRYIDGTLALDVSHYDDTHLSPQGHIKLAELLFDEIGGIAL